MSKNRVLITGAAGFIGSHLSDKFISEGNEVIGVDNLITGELKNIEHLNSHEYFTFIKHDIIEKLSIEGPIDYILHFASPASPVDYMKYPIETLQVGSYGIKNMLDLALSKKSTILIASTSEIYGDPNVSPQTEEYWGNVNPIGPRSVYDEAKRFQEAITMAYHREFNLDIRIARIFNTYGPRMRPFDGRVFPNFIRQALNHENLPVYGDGSQTRSFCYVDDLIDGIYKLLHSNYQNPINLGNPEEIKILDLAHEVIEFCQSKGKIEFSEILADDPLQRKPDISKAREILGWEPKTSRSEGMRILVENYQSLIS